MAKPVSAKAWGSLHQLDPVAAGCDGEGAIGAPELAGVLDLEAGVPQALLGLGVVGGHDRGVPERRCGVSLGEDQVDLSAVVLQPADGVAEHVGRGDLLEAEQAPELDRAIGLIRRDLQRDVMEHGASISDRAS